MSTRVWQGGGPDRRVLMEKEVGLAFAGKKSKKTELRKEL